MEAHRWMPEQWAIIVEDDDSSFVLIAGPKSVIKARAARLRKAFVGYVTQLIEEEIDEKKEGS